MIKRYEVIYTNKGDKDKLEHSTHIWANSKAQAKSEVKYNFPYPIVVKRANSY